MNPEVISDKSKTSYVFTNTFKALFYPRVIFMFLFSTFGVLLFWVGVGFAIWPKLSAWATQTGIQSPFWVNYIQQSEYLKHFDLISVVLFIVLLFIGVPLILVSATALSSFISSTYLIQYLGNKDFPALEKKGDSRLGASLWNLFKYTIVFLFLNFMIIPLSWIFAAGPIFSWGLIAWYNQKIGSFDVLTMWADDQEFKALRSEENLRSYIISTLASVTVFVPFTFLIMPIIVNIALTYYYLARLQNLRQTVQA